MPPSQPLPPPLPPAFTERPAWTPIGPGWLPIHGSFQGIGFSIEWHDFSHPDDLDWAASFHPAGLELCLNLAGTGRIVGPHGTTLLTPGSAVFYCNPGHRLAGTRPRKEQHRFLTIEYSQPFLAHHFVGAQTELHLLARSALDPNTAQPGASTPLPLSTAQHQLVEALRNPPVPESTRPIWYSCKVLELALMFFFDEGRQSSGSRQERVARERVDQVIALLRADLTEPPSLEELGRQIGCSQFHLSRTFSNHTGMTITQCLRRLRLEKAAELLKSGKYNVTEAAVEVGYSSPSHFSQAFHEMFGCCPGLYPVRLPGQESLRRRLPRA